MRPRFLAALSLRGAARRQAARRQAAAAVARRRQAAHTPGGEARRARVVGSGVEWSGVERGEARRRWHARAGEGLEYVHCRVIEGAERHLHLPVLVRRAQPRHGQLQLPHLAVHRRSVHGGQLRELRRRCLRETAAPAGRRCGAGAPGRAHLLLRTLTAHDRTQIFVPDAQYLVHRVVGHGLETETGAHRQLCRARRGANIARVGARRRRRARRARTRRRRLSTKARTL